MLDLLALVELHDGVEMLAEVLHLLLVDLPLLLLLLGLLDRLHKRTVVKQQMPYTDQLKEIASYTNIEYSSKALLVSCCSIVLDQM